MFCDAIVPNIQEKLMHGTSTEAATQNNETMEMKSLINDVETQSANSSIQTGMSSMSLMVNTNAIGFTLLFLSTIISSSIRAILHNITTHPHYFFLLLTVGVSLGTAVLAYTELIRRSGPAVAVGVATLRKVVTVVLSYIIFPKSMSRTHVLSFGLVLLGLTIGFVGRRKK